MRTEIQEKLTHVVHAVAALYILVVFLSLFAVKGHIFELPVIIVDTVVSALYFFDLFINRKRTKVAWFIDGLSVLPFFLLFGSTPLALVCNAGKLLRGLRGISGIHFRKQGFDVSSGIKVAITFITLVTYFATLIVLLEGDVNQNLSTVEGGLWWAVVTITTTGYGDVTPETPLGRFVAAILMLMGIGISSAVGAVFVSFLLHPTEERILKQENRVARSEGKIESEERKSLQLLRSIDRRLSMLEQAKRRRKK